MNSYTSITNITAMDTWLKSLDTTLLLSAIQSASRLVDHYARREFYVHYGTKRYVIRSIVVDVDDLLSVSTVKMINGTYEKILTTDEYTLGSWNDKAPYTWIALSAGVIGATLEITGWFGVGNLESSSPFASIGVTCTCDDSSTELNFTSASIAQGDMIRIDDEIMYVESVSETTTTVRRAQNGTTAAAHTNAVVLVPLYPSIVTSCTNYAALCMIRKIQNAGISAERLGDYSYTNDVDAFDFLEQALNTVRRFR